MAAGPAFALLVLTMFLCIGQLLARDQRAEAARHALHRDLADQLVERHADRQHPEQSQDRGRGDDPDAVTGERVERVLAQRIRALETTEARETDEYDEVEGDEKEQSRGLGRDAERPHLHRHQQRNAEDDRPAECTGEAARIKLIGS